MALAMTVAAHALDTGPSPGLDNTGVKNTFESNFADSTLRIDWIMGAATPQIMLRQMSKSPGWAGRRHNLERLPLKGNGDVTVRDAQTGDTLYRTSFSTLYNEWLTLGDTVGRAFEHTVNVPLPRRRADIGCTLYDARQQPCAHRTIPYDPADILVRRPRPNNPDTTAIHRGTRPGHRIKVAILPEGFDSTARDTFMTFARRTVNAIIAHAPFDTLADRFDFTAVWIPSADNTVSVPKKGLWTSTALGSHFSTFYSDRYLTTPDVFAVHDALAGVPFEHIIILANTDVYGGGGIYNDYTLTTTGHKNFEPVVVHEFGHSFGGLADEYFYDNDVMTDTYPTDIEPWEPNITTLVGFGTKWQDIIAPGTPVPTPAENAGIYPCGVFEGGGYSAKGIFRPADICRMRLNTAPGFCPACRRALRNLIIFMTEDR